VCRVKRGGRAKSVASPRGANGKAGKVQRVAEERNRALQGPGLVPAAIREPGY
jgi:hypothetical protein